jgi:hypothetical protein
MITSSDSNQGLARKVTAMGVVGEMNQLFTVYEAKWNCSGECVSACKLANIAHPLTHAP